MWSRRELLAALGASGASVALGGWLGACAGPQQRRQTSVAGVRLDDLLPQLLTLVDQRLPGAFVWSRRSKRHRVTRDSVEQSFDLVMSEEVVIGGDGHTLGFLNANREELLSKTQTFVANLPKGPGDKATAQGPFTLPAQDSIVGKFKIDPGTQPHEAFHTPVAQLYEQSQGVGSSRIIYRNAYLLSDEDEVRFLSRTRNQRRREIRQRKGVLFAAWTGDDVSSSVAEHFGSGGLEVRGPSPSELEKSAEDALAHVHARSAPSGLQDIILSPSCASLVAMEAIAKPAFANGARPSQSPFLRVSNDPTRRQGYGSYLSDARGDSPKVLALFGEQDALSMQEGNMRRDKELRVLARPGNVIVQAGALSEQELVAEVAEGVYVDAPIHCSVDPLGRSMALLCGRGREIRDGRFTGRLFSRLLCSSSSAAFFSGTRALGNSVRDLAMEDAGLAMSAQAPAWLSRAQVEAG